MAWTVARTQMVVGNKRAVGLNLTADAATQTIYTGLKRVEAISIGHMSVTSNGLHVYYNSNASGVATDGVIGCSGFTSGDRLYVVVYGQS